MQTKVCSKCKIDKPHSDYFKDKRRDIGIRCKCKICCNQDTMDWRKKNKSEYNNYTAMWRSKNPERQHATEIKRRYSLSVERYNELLVEQKCGCKICGKQHDPSLKRGRLYVDHDHKTGEVRSLLCANCNKGLGCLMDNPAILLRAIDYLEGKL